MVNPNVNKVEQRLVTSVRRRAAFEMKDGILFVMDVREFVP
jgi:hypothetical protein